MTIMHFDCIFLNMSSPMAKNRRACAKEIKWKRGFEITEEAKERERKQKKKVPER